MPKGIYIRTKGNGWLGKHHSVKSRIKMSEAKKGDKNYNWKGGMREELKIIRQSLEYRLWREKIFERDNYTCQICNIKGGDLNADHIKPFAFYEELRFDLDNGRTLCIECHKKTETYGKNLIINNKF